MPPADRHRLVQGVASVIRRDRLEPGVFRLRRRGKLSLCVDSIAVGILPEFLHVLEHRQPPAIREHDAIARAADGLPAEGHALDPLIEREPAVHRRVQRQSSSPHARRRARERGAMYVDAAVKPAARRVHDERFVVHITQRSAGAPRPATVFRPEQGQPCLDRRPGCQRNVRHVRRSIGTVGTRRIATMIPGIALERALPMPAAVL